MNVAMEVASGRSGALGCSPSALSSMLGAALAVDLVLGSELGRRLQPGLEVVGR